MLPDERLPVVFCWHMHQPEYRDLSRDTFIRPWTYLHAIKDYADMAAHLEACPGARVVVNFSPVLIEQLKAYERQIAACLAGSGDIGDPLLAALAAPALPLAGAQRSELLANCLRLNKGCLVEPSPPFRVLYEFGELALAHHGAHWLSDACLFDLLTWYHLAWLGATIRAREPLVRALRERGGGFSYDDRRALLALIHDTITGVRRGYSVLAARGQIEIAASPYGHPIMPLLIDFNSAHEALPHAKLPQARAYPGGAARVAWHLATASAVVADYFGVAPRGCWPSEGALSQAVLDAVGTAGFDWTATGQGVIAGSFERAGRAHVPHAMYRDPRSGVNVFARDDELSDRIGFTYAGWGAHDAVSDLEHALIGIADHAIAGETVVTIIMDGENAWEHYPNNADEFLSLLYARLADHERLRMTTFSDARQELKAVDLPPLVAGSWVYGTLSTWIGEAAKNQLWDLLVAAKSAFDASPAGNAAMSHELAHQLAVCEGSDWFWWPSDHEPAATVGDFEQLFHMHLANFYQAFGAPVPDTVTAALQAAPRSESGPVMRSGSG